MKRLVCTLFLTLLLATAVQAAQESEVNVERLTIKSDIKLNIDSPIKEIIIHRIELIDDNTMKGNVIITAEVITTEGKHINKQFIKSVTGGHNYYYEILSGPLKRLEKRK